ncbi:acyltransferase family protein [Rhizobium sp. NFR03]|uniref:acyltransferase family protein n=1 Tax=Rhizobium sp. NFR03 TaxID=1566263 RepID=UPI0008BFFCB4|nr:acyltransferase family protein [Rhizobium sp. NFR03]SES47922.1 Peptidoglycan/LPS O-acetylase OafA/YrhL, contains acyltransferase and SGNH-hydrolase domains [Rhizobium sp. NFR03]
MIYRPEIDGLRAVAVGVVVLYHAGFPLTGGFVGVDIFFVISGYLITTVIVEDVKAGSFSLISFYERRARRILPALIAVLLFTVPFALMWLIPAEFEAYSQSLIASLLSFSNIEFWTEQGYFATDADRLPLLHTWSLAVEEQFYLIFPILALSVIRWRKTWLTPIISALAILSFLVALLGVKAYPDANFYFLSSRAWELLAGSLFCFLTASRLRWVNDVVSATALSLTLLSAALLTADDPWPSALTLVPVIGAGTLLVFGIQGTLAARILSIPPLTGLGLISYSVYLWHQPIFAFARIRSDAAPSPLMMLILALLVVIVGFLSWRFVERPFRKGPDHLPKSRYRFIAIVASASFVLILVGATGQMTVGFPGRLAPATAAMIEESGWSRDCMFSSDDVMPEFPMRACIFNQLNPTRYALWGDSVASSLRPALAEELNKRGIAVQQFTHGFCAPLPGISMAYNEEGRRCASFNRQVINQILASDIDTVILAASWASFFFSKSYDVDEVLRTTEGNNRQFVITRLKETIAILERAGRRVILIFPHPVPTVKGVDAVARMMQKGVAKPTITIAYQDFLAETTRSRLALDEASSALTMKVRPERAFCGTSRPPTCLIAQSGTLFIADELHFTKAGAARLVGEVMRMKEFGPEQR